MREPIEKRQDRGARLHGWRDGFDSCVQIVGFAGHDHDVRRQRVSRIQYGPRGRAKAPERAFNDEARGRGVVPRAALAPRTLRRRRMRARWPPKKPPIPPAPRKSVRIARVLRREKISLYGEYTLGQAISGVSAAVCCL